MGLIDREAFRKRLISKYHCVPVVGIPYGDNWESLDEALSDEPTIDAAPAVHRHIVGSGYSLHCSNCGDSANIGDNYCPSCGARLDGDEEHGSDQSG